MHRWSAYENIGNKSKKLKNKGNVGAFVKI